MANVIHPHELICPPAAMPINASLWAVRALFCLNGFLYATWATRIPAIQSQFQLSNGTLGLALMVVAAGAVVAMPCAGWLCSRLGSRRIAAISLAFYLIGLPTISLMPSLAMLIAALFLFGVGHGMLDVSMNVQALEVERRMNQQINSSIHALWSIGGLVGALAGSLIAMGGLNVRWHFILVAAVFTTATVPIIARLLHDRVEDKRASRDQTLSRQNRNAASVVADLPAHDRAPRHTTLVLGVIAFCVMAGEGAMADWSAVLLHQVLGIGEGVAAMGYATFAIAMAMGRFAGDRFSAWLGPVKQVRVCAFVAMIGVLIVVTSYHVVTAMIGFTLIGAGLATIVPAVFSACGKLPGSSPGVALATVSTIGYFGFLLGPPLIGLLSEWVSLRVALSTLAGTMLVTMTLASATRPRRQ
ncbi:Major facilitator superfamily MFS-1 [Rhodopirellula maiorica SM1]|uniref:Major facilitator superfamily MFS-1 n=1 Tax=Rhodopirellula maiorica SM1 TaxID=1265738 RepID=M5RY27_9BACT|nr:MFS transporter [Rhodopirellula maiorica]EMI18819.1 Major facilitator superfamily MFS-1 [Rhodopirellula maiorica SM1]